MPALSWFVVAFFVADAAVIGAYLVSAATPPIEPELDLNREGNLPTYFAAAQLTVVGALMAVVAAARFSPRWVRSWLLLGMPVLFVVLAADEVLRLHEDVGLMLDDLPGADRRELPFNRTGIWMFAVGLPFTATLFWYGHLVRGFFPFAPTMLAAAGFGIFMGGAIGIEIFANFVEPGTDAETIQVVGEEGFELIGVTVILWAVHAVVRSDRADQRLRQ